MRLTKRVFFLRSTSLLVISLLYGNASWTEESVTSRLTTTLSETAIGYRGLTCGQCKYRFLEYCSSTPKASAVALVAGARQVDAEKKCAAAESFNDYAPCEATTVNRFDRIVFLKNLGAVRESDSFASQHTFSVQDSLQMKKRGVFIDPGRAYVILAFPRQKEVSPKAAWDVLIACEIPSSDLDQEIVERATDKGAK